MHNSANEAAACLVELVNKEHDDTFSTLAEMQEHTEEKAMNQKKQRANESSERAEELVVKREDDELVLTIVSVWNLHNH